MINKTNILTIIPGVLFLRFGINDYEQSYTSWKYGLKLVKLWPGLDIPNSILFILFQHDLSFRLEAALTASAAASIHPFSYLMVAQFF
jgi:hypothetical protein